MFNKRKVIYEVTRMDDLTIETYKSESNANDVIFYLRLHRITEFDKLKSKGVVFIGDPAVEPFLSGQLCYVGFNRKYFVHRSYFKHNFENSIHNNPDGLKLQLESMRQPLKKIAQANLKGALVSYGYHKDRRIWMKLSHINSQRDIGEVRSYRLITDLQEARVPDMLNKKFPDGKRVERSEKSQ